ncbi:YdcF family protein [Actinacidiphila sp. DG2A-62]|uniref:YdcF family protein n=1 Tax=Actinacidiphila sp. DG2A-62 TaxID=3108821 RepID=UPI002DB964A9|nr:YdcF family protein [Actinacidiphila sp. DG2A-62]MEC3996213.1 YdcF family protein [Actinacidiphila sp. DG2A-62]
MSERGQRAIGDGQRDAARRLWDYCRLGHEPRACAVGIGLGSHDLGVASRAAELFHAGMFPVIVFSGGNSRTTVARFPRGEAVHYREHALALGVPDAAILVEPRARNTGENVTFSRRVLAGAGIVPESVMVVCKPYAERRSYATVRKLWPQVDVVCASEALGFEEYVKGIGDAKLVVDMLVGDVQRIMAYPRLGFAVEQDVPDEVRAAYEVLVRDGFTSRLVAG